MMKVAVWSHLPQALFSTSGEDSEVRFVRVPMGEAANRLREGAFDVALVPTLTVMQQADDFDVFPAVGFSSWDYPYARLHPTRGLSAPMHTLVHEGAHEMTVLVARIVLREHYGTNVEVVQPDDAGAGGVTGDVTLVMTEAIEAGAEDSASLDVGREWFELAAYPMVWGLFVALKGEATPAAIVALRDAVNAAEARVAGAAESVDAATQDFLENQARLRVDDLAVASLTEFSNYVYFYGALPEYPSVPFVSLPDDDAEASGNAATPLV